MTQLLCTIFITNNRTLFLLWQNENFVKHQKVSKYYDHHCRRRVFIKYYKINYLILLKVKILIGSSMDLLQWFTISQSVSQSVSQPASQPASQPVSQSVSQLNWCIFLTGINSCLTSWSCMWKFVFVAVICVATLTL